MAEFRLVQTSNRGINGIVGPQMLIDNTNGSRNVRIDDVIVSATAQVGAVSITRMRTNVTVGTLTNHSEINALPNLIGQNNVNLSGCRVYEWDGVGTGIGGISGGTLYEGAAMGLGTNRVEYGKGIVIPPGVAVAIYVLGLTGDQTLVMVKGSLN